MDDVPANEPTGEAPQGEGYGLSRRDFAKVAAILTGSTLLMLSRCKLPFDPVLPSIPSNFKRFILTKQSPIVATEKIVVALGSQCPDLRCALWWGENREFQFFESVSQIENLYVDNGRNELFWLD